MLKAILGLSLLCAACSPAGKETANAGKQKPNVLFIAVDDLRPQLGCYGDTRAVTPNIDRLAARGTTFTRAYCQQAVCAPSRASLMTGRRPDAIKVWDLGTHFRENVPDIITLPQYFKQQGYHTRVVGKIYHDPASAQDSLSWSHPELMAVTGKVGGKYALDSNLHRKGSWKAAATERASVPDSVYADGKVIRGALQTLREISDRPFFLAVGFRRPHLPFSAPAKYWDMYDRESLPLPANPETPHNAPEPALHTSVELRGYSDVPDEGPIPEAKVRELIHGYYASISFIDAQIGKLLDELERLGLAENTIIVLWSDHGFHLGEQGMWAKATNFEASTRVPLIVSAPGQSRKGVQSEALVELVDIYPSLAELAGLPVPGGLEGASFAPLLQDPERAWKKAAFSQFPRPWFYRHNPSLMGYSLRTERYRYTEWRDFKTGETVARELYDHKEDPLESRNVAGEESYSEDIAALEKLMQGGWKEALPAQ